MSELPRPQKPQVLAPSARCVWRPTNQRSIWKRLKTLRAPPWQPPAWCSILIGAALFSLVFRGFGGDELIEAFFAELGGGPHMALLIVMLVMFLLGSFSISSK